MRVSNATKLRKQNKNVWDVTQERGSQKARLLNFSTGHKVEMFWDLNKSTIEDQVFLMKIGDKEAMISAEEMRRFLRWI